MRRVGVSYLIDTGGAGGLDVEALWSLFERSYGVAVSAMRAFPPPRENHLTSIFVDRKGDSWDGLRGRLTEWVQALGARGLRWEPLADVEVAVLRFDVGPLKG
jgi:hypothetical protein